ncbi:MAG: hypothetical protein ABIQ72_14155 [Usitatibacter sp.]
MSANATAWRGGAIALGLLLAWRIISVNAVLYDDNGRPQLPGASSARDLVEILRTNPAEVAALLVMAQSREQSGDIAGATRAYESALQLAPIDRDTLTLASAFFLRQKRVPEALVQLDRLVDNYGEFDKVFPVFSQLLAAREPGMQAIAARNPKWLGRFIADGCRRNVDPVLLAPLLQRRAAGGAMHSDEVGCVTASLRTAGKWDVAYQVWLNTLPRERLADVGFVFNGSFEYEPSGVGFDWRIAKGAEREVGNAVAFASANSGAGKRALRVSYTGKRQAAAAIEEYLAVAPGRYELSGLARMDQLSSVRGLQWALRCVAAEGAGRTLAVSERFLAGGEWRPFSMAVSIPADCRGQVLQLEPAGLNEGTTYVAGTAWFDDLRLTRAR